MLRPAGLLAPRIMSVVLATLLYLGLCLAQSTQTQEGNLSPPVITALPGPVVPRKNPVTILCQGPPEAEVYEIHRLEDIKPVGTGKILATVNTLYITEMTPDITGQYHCLYKIGKKWSQFSDLLLVVMTGAYEKPSLLNVSGMVVASGENVMLQCFSSFKFDVFILNKEDALHSTQNQSSTPQGNGRQATFHMDRVTSTQAGTYKCYGVLNGTPNVWSCPSDPLELVIKAPNNQTQYVLIGLPVASILLLLLFIIVCIVSHRKAKNNAHRAERQAPEAIDPQDVTYLKVTFDVPNQGAAPIPSFLPRQTQTSEYATLSLR